MPIKGIHRDVATIALRAGAIQGFALAGGNALIAYGLISRPMQDVDLFTDREGGVELAAGAVEAALRAAGYKTERRDKTGGLAEIWPDIGTGMAEWVVSRRGERTMLQLAFFDRLKPAVSMSVGPVLSLEDVVGGKVVALISRAEVRDYADTAAALALSRWTVTDLIRMARRRDCGLPDGAVADVGRRLDRMPDSAFTRLGLSPAAVATLRARFEPWPRPRK